MVKDKCRVFNKVLKFKQWEVVPVLYKSPILGINFLTLVESNTKEIIAHCHAEVDYKTANNELLIKDWSENEGMLEWLYDNKIINSVNAFLDNGYVIIPIGILNLDRFIEEG